jgi:hypothetical protein
MIQILIAIAAVVTILTGIAKFTDWGRGQWKRFRRFISRYHPKVPRKTVRVIPQYYDIWWALGSVKGEPSMQLACRCYITNISAVDVRICEVSLRKPKTIGRIFVRHPQQDVYGRYPIPPGCTTEASADFWIRPPICEEDEPLVADIDFTDQFGNRHRVRNVKFHPRPKKKEKPTAPQMEVVSDISNPVERKVAGILQAEVYRYKDCGRRVGGLGSIQTTYQGRSYCGVGTDWRKADSPELQAIVPDPENARIESDNASTLIKYYKSLKNQQRNDFVESLLRRLSRETPYAPVGYLILLVLYRIGYLNKVLETAKKQLQSDSAHGFSDFLRLLDGLLKYEYRRFSAEMLDDIEQFLKGIKEHTFRISERLLAVRAFLLRNGMEKKEK